jgi:class 3 adenylate cyclase/tetratricopeptide (TPR) repeat protein
MKCAKCGHDNRTGAKFCEECGAHLSAVCMNCGAQLSPTARFCSECGHPIDQAAASGPDSAPRFAAPEAYTPRHLAEKILSSKSALEGERKQVTALFADLKSSMELFADRDPEEARRLLDPVISHMMEAVHGYEGTVNHVLGDGIVALFGAPLAHEDHAVRACYAALRMQESVKKYAEEVSRSVGLRIRIRVGLNSGEVVVRAIGSDLHMDYTAVGQTMHLAARMEQLADPGTVLLAPASLALAEDFVQVKSLGPMPVKGLSEPVEVYELMGANPARSRFQAHAARGLTKFVGRTCEIAQLGEALDLARNSRGQVIAVVGEPGVGKSRLAWEFAHSHRTDGCLVIEAGSVSYGKAMAHLPVIELLRHYFQIEPRDDLRKIREKVTGKLLSLDRGLEPALPALLALLDVLVEDPQWTRLDPPQRRQRTLDAVKRLLLRESDVQPLVVIFEDLHWMDGETQAVLDRLVESLPTARMVLLVNYRPEYQHQWSSKTYYRQVRLDALPSASAEELLEALLGNDPSLAPIKPLLIERTEGNPFFLEESVRTLVETKVLGGAAGAYRLTRAPAGLQIPATAQAIVAARIDRLDPEDKRLLQGAAVIGTDVPLALLEAIADVPESGLPQSLARLQAAEFLYETRLFPEVEYTFKHALTHEVTYGGLLQERRRTLHAEVVGAIERTSGERLVEHTERLAHHAFRGELWEKAFGYLRQAGTRAMAHSAYREAVPLLEQALEVLRRLPVTGETIDQAIEVRIALRSSLFVLNEHGRVRQLLDEAAVLAEKRGDHRRLGWIFAYAAISHVVEGDHQAALDTAQRAHLLGNDVGDLGVLAYANEHLGLAHLMLGNYQNGVERLRAALAFLRDVPPQERFGRAAHPSVAPRGFLARCLAERGDFVEARAVAEEALTIAKNVGHEFSRIVAHAALGHVHFWRGELRDALDNLELAFRSVESANVPQPRVGFGSIQAWLGLVYAELGCIDDAQRVLDSMLERSNAQEVRSLLCAAQAYLTAGHEERARELAARALSSSWQRGERGHEALARWLLGELTHVLDPRDAPAAEAHYDQALTLAEPRGMRPLVAHCHAGLAKLYPRTGKRTESDEHIVAATAMYREMGMNFWLQKAEAEMRQLG